MTLTPDLNTSPAQLGANTRDLSQRVEPANRFAQSSGTLTAPTSVLFKAENLKFTGEVVLFCDASGRLPVPTLWKPGQDPLPKPSPEAVLKTCTDKSGNEWCYWGAAPVTNLWKYGDPPSCPKLPGTHAENGPNGTVSWVPDRPAGKAPSQPSSPARAPMNIGGDLGPMPVSWRVATDKPKPMPAPVEGWEWSLFTLTNQKGDVLGYSWVPVKPGSATVSVGGPACAAKVAKQRR